MSILAYVVAFSHVINSASTDVADGSDALVPLSLDVAKLQLLTLVASDSCINVNSFVAACAAVKITISSWILADVVSLSDIEIIPADIADSPCNSIVRRTQSRHIWKLKNLSLVASLPLNDLDAYLYLLASTLLVESIVTTFAFVPIALLVASVIPICNVWHYFSANITIYCKSHIQKPPSVFLVGSVPNRMATGTHLNLFCWLNKWIWLVLHLRVLILHHLWLSPGVLLLLHLHGL